MSRACLPRLIASLAFSIVPAFAQTDGKRLELRDASNRPLRGVTVRLSDAAGKSLELKASAEGQIILPKDFRATRVATTALEGPGATLAIDVRGLSENDLNSLRLTGERTPQLPQTNIRNVRGALNGMPLQVLDDDWNQLADKLRSDGESSSAIADVERAIAALKLAHGRAQKQLALPATATAEVVLDRIDKCEPVITAWSDLRRTVTTLARQVASRADREIVAATRQFEGRFVGPDSHFQRQVGAIGQAVDTPLISLAASSVRATLEGLGMDKVEIQVRLERLTLDKRTGKSVATAHSAPAEGVRVEFQRELCSLTPDSVTIQPSRSLASTFAISDSTDGLARIVATSPGFANVELRVLLSPPYSSVMTILIGLLAGMFLRRRLLQKDGRASISLGVHIVGALVLMAVWFAGYIAYLAPRIEVIDPRAGMWQRATAGVVCGFLGLPLVNAWLTRWLRGE
ncbi:MAG: hypothetical protein AB7I19_11025 [Planctomycetota bacterium]